MVYGSNLSGLKYFFVCKPTGGGTSASSIDLKYEGADSVKIGASGELIIYTPLGNIMQPKAAAWQLDANGDYTSLGWQPSYTLLGTNEVGFTSLGSFNAALPLIIAVNWGGAFSLVCPQGVIWSTYMGGGTGFDQFHSIKTTASGDVYVAGETSCPNFPGVTGLSAQNFLAGGMDAVVSKIYPDGPIHWSSYYGGDFDSQGGSGAADRAFAVDIDASGNVYFVGETQSTDFICVQLSGAYYDNSLTQPSGTAQDQFLVKLSSDGQTPLWATYYGGNNPDIARALSISPIDGDIYMAGWSYGNFPLQTLSGAYNGPSGQGGTIVKFNSSGTRVWATTLGSSGVEGITVDQNNDLVAVGTVNTATNFPIQNASGNTTYGGGQNDGFVTKFDGNSMAVVWSTLFGGDGRDICRDVVAVQEGTDIFYYVVGISNSSSVSPIPLVQPGFGEYYQGAVASSLEDGFIAQFHSIGQLFWSTYMGGSDFDEFYAVTADSDDNIYLTGMVYSSDFPMPVSNAANAFVVTSLGGNTDAIDVCFLRGIHSYVWGSYHGGGWAEIGWDVACVGNSRLYVVGESGDPTNFPFCQGTPTANGTPYYDDQPGIKGFISDLDLSPVIVAGINTPEENTSGFMVYPNPADQLLIISGQTDAGEAVTIEIIDVTGRAVYSETDQSSGMLNKQIDISNLANGMYVIKVTANVTVSTEKVVIQR